MSEKTAMHTDQDPNTHQERRPTSDRQVAANRENAQRSTGPRTAGGKQRSAQNATKHGAFADSMRAITRGPLGEDPALFDVHVDELVNALGPRDAIEIGVASQIAHCMIRLERIGCYETHLLDRDSGFGDQFPVTDEATLTIDEDTFAALVTFAQGSMTDCEEDPEHLAHVVIHLTGEGDVSIPDPSTGEREPADRSEWTQLLRQLVQDIFGDGPTLARWANEEMSRLQAYVRMLDATFGPIAADKAVTNTLPKTSLLQTRVGRELERLLKRYQILQDRDRHHAD